jgi:peptidoglycan L-alanyl-D-glutamate endopeptidase CwlK
MNQRTIDNLKGLHPDLVKVAEQTLADNPDMFVITEGLRTIEKQRQLLAAGATTTLRSRHLTGHAFDVAALVNGEIRWDWPLYKAIADAIKAKAALLGIKIQWGGDWKTFKDGPHFQLDKTQYP